MNRKYIFLLVSSLFATSAYAGFEVVEPTGDFIKQVPAKTAEAPVKAIVQPLVKTKVVTTTTPTTKVKITTKTETSAPVQVAAVAPIGRTAIISGLTHIGRKPAIIPSIKGFGKEVPLKDALQQIIPGSFQVYNDNQVSLAGIISWSASESSDWVGVLDKSLRQAGVSGVIDWDSKTISLDKSKNAQAAIEAAEPKWQLRTSDRSLRQSMIRWAKDAGYHIDWDVAVDFPISIESSFTGDFEGAVTQVMDSLAGTDYPLQACSYENKTIRIIRYGESNRCLSR